MSIHITLQITGFIALSLCGLALMALGLTELNNLTHMTRRERNRERLLLIIMIGMGLAFQLAAFDQIPQLYYQLTRTF